MITRYPVIQYFHPYSQHRLNMQTKKAIDILVQHNNPNLKIVRNRVNFTKLMDILGHPYRSFKSVHITGTNGKGSVALKTANILKHHFLKQSASARIGLYTSPHLFTFRERIQLNGQLTGMESIVDKVIHINSICVKQQMLISYFEYLTAAAFMYFQEQKCEYVALEVGLGGRKDTTNIVEPEVSVITSIGLDHVDILGPTIQHIASEKSGIIKPRKPVVLGPSADISDLINVAHQNKSNIYKVKKSPEQLNFNQQNNKIAEKVIEALNTEYQLSIQTDSIECGLNSRQPCRMELLDSKYNPKWAPDLKVYFDVGHNLQAIKRVKEYLKQHNVQGNELTIVFGTSKGKNINQMLMQLEGYAKNIYLIEANHERAAKIKELQSYVGMAKRPSLFRIINQGNIGRTLSYVTADPSTKNVLVCGSFFIMSEARSFFQPELVGNQEENINECFQLNNN